MNFFTEWRLKIARDHWKKEPKYNRNEGKKNQENQVAQNVKKKKKK